MTESEDVTRSDRMDRNNNAIDDLIAANESSNRSMLALVESVRQETAARDRKIDVLEKNHRQMNYVMAAVCAAIAVMLALGTVNAINLASGRAQQEQIRQLNGVMLDCVNSTGACGQANAVQQARILDSVKQYELTGFYCLRNNPGTADPKGEAFLACMKRLYPGGPTLQGRTP